ncbi:hypothetical protein [Ottowia testudinis]|uniref:Uncharacterized protein n=1 Tax=Ottowia testudinis TaxID=2816950 RepID=A0A975H2T9_9BURK|nr:hypothetical protein [Ottowia testudinis]QTD44550.1 hypothetical protein J1M35_15835 [Ottowia testudinis]
MTSLENAANRWWSAALMVLLTTIGGCGTIAGSDSEPSYKSGEKPSFTIGSIYRDDHEAKNDKGEVRIRPELAKLALTQPTNSSAYIFLKKESGVDIAMACVTPAAAGLTQGVVSVQEATGTLANKGGISAKNTEGVSQGMLILTSIDIANQFLANASFANCLAYASGMVDGPTAGKNLREYILKAGDIALKLAEGKPSSDRTDSIQTPAPGVPAAGADSPPASGASSAGGAQKPTDSKPEDKKNSRTTSPMYESMRGRPVIIQ